MKTGGDIVTEAYPLFQKESGGAIPTSPLHLYIKEINKVTAKNCYRRWHYLKDTDFIQMFNYGAYFNGMIVGAISYGPPSAPETVKGLFGTTNQQGYFEIKRLAMNDDCPKNSESRFIAISCKLLRRTTEVKGIVTYADSSVNHTGIIYKASGFEYKGLTAPKKDFWVNGRIKQRGKTKGVKGEWKDRPRKHLFIKIFKTIKKLEIISEEVK